MIFQGLSVARNCLRPETAPLTILAIKRGLSCNFAKNFKSVLLCPFKRAAVLRGKAAQI